LSTVQSDVASLGMRVDQTNAALAGRLDQMTKRIDDGVDATTRRIDTLISGLAEVKAIVSSVASDTSSLRQKQDEADRVMDRISDRVFYSSITSTPRPVPGLPSGMTTVLHDGQLYIVPASAQERREIERLGLNLGRLPSGMEAYVLPRPPAAETDGDRSRP